MEASRKIFHYPDVTAYGSLSVITKLEFFQHHFSQMGHGDLLVTQIYISGEATTAPSASRVASAARAASFKRACGKLRVNEYSTSGRKKKAGILDSGLVDHEMVAGVRFELTTFGL